MTDATIAGRLERALAPFVGGALPVHLTAWDGSSAGPAQAPGVRLNSPDALRRILWQPGELGAAQAYVTGELEVEGDLDAGLTQVRATLAERGVSGLPRNPVALAAAARTIGALVGLSLPPAPPETQARLPRGLRGRLHHQARDRWAISHHYDLSTEFYELILDPSMAYSCGYHTAPDGPTYGLAEAQRDKFDLVLAKLGLEPGMTMLDVGCGWGSLSLHAAARGIHVTGLTIAAEQHAFIGKRVAERGLEETMTVRLCDYRDSVGEFDAVASLEMGEHVGQRHYPTYVEVLRRSVRPGGRVLVQQMSRAGRRGGANPGGGPFIESFIAPDMHMRPVGETVALIEAGGLEVRDVHALREHYVRTVAGWQQRFAENRAEIEARWGTELARVWDLYLVGGSAAFRDGRMGVDQILAVRPTPSGDSGLPAVRTW